VKKKIVSKKQPSVSKTQMKCCGFNETCQGGHAIYGVGFIGAVVYYVASATSFLAGFLGVLKALVWPAFLVYELMKFLAM